MLVHYKPLPSDWAAGQWEERLSWQGHPYWVWSPFMPKIEDQLLRCIFYIYMSEDEAKQGNVDSATGFIFGIPSEYRKTSAFLYAVTNRHVIEGISTETPFLRVNTLDDSFDIIVTKKEDWKFHPLMCDLAICGLGLESNKYDISYLNPDFLLTKEFMEEMNVGAGDDVFMIGNFQTRGGKKKNYPTVRFGNIAQIPNEPMKNPHTGFDEESFIVEMRSASGFSGSPVILTISALFPRFHNDEMHTFRSRREKPDFKPKVDRRYDYYRLLGIDWGHIRTKERLYDKDGKTLPDRESVWINSAMAGVVPSWRLYEMLYDDENIQIRKTIDEKVKEEIEQSEVVVDFEQKDKQELTKEEFEDTLRKIARPLKPDDQEKKGT